MNDKLYSIQYLRGIAALAVVVAHAAAHPLAGDNVLLSRLGEFGVMLFFVISGFIMVAITGPGRFAPGAFLKRRIVRIVPLYWLFTTLAAVLALALPALFKTTVFTWPHYLQSLAFLPHEAPERGGTSPLLSLGWTLNYEAFFYVCFALCAALTAGWRVVVLSVLFGTLALYGAVMRPVDPVLSFYANQSVLAFVSGAVIGYLKLAGATDRLPIGGVWRLGLAVVAGLAVAFGSSAPSGESWWAFAGLLVAGSGLVAMGLRLEAGLPRWNFGVLVGDASYAIYLVHMFAVGGVVAVAARVLPHDSALAYAGTVAVAVIGATFAGIIVHKLVELPLLNWMRGGRTGARGRAIAGA